MANIRKRGPGRYQIRVMIDGQTHSKTVTAESKTAANKMAEAWERQLTEEAQRRAMGLPGRMTVGELLTAYERDKLPGLAASTRRTYRVTLRNLLAFLTERHDGADTRAHEIRAGIIRSYLTWRRHHSADASGDVTEPVVDQEWTVQKREASARTLAKDRATISALFSYAREVEAVDANPVDVVDAPKVDERDPVILTDDQFEKLLGECRDPMLRLYVLTLAETGTRSGSEALWLRWEDVDLEAGFLWVASDPKRDHRTKSGKGRWVPMTPRLRQALRDHFAAYRFKTYNDKRTPWIFHHVVNRRRAKAGDRIGSLRRGFDAAAERAELPDGFVQHDLRHRRVTTWLADGKNPVHVKEAVGHADLRTTMGYTHLAREHLRGLVDDEDAGTEATGTD